MRTLTGYKLILDLGVDDTIHAMTYYEPTNCVYVAADSGIYQINEDESITKMSDGQSCH